MMGLKGRGLLITFEGIEGSGKTTQLKRLAAALKKQRYPVVSTHEPGGTPLGEKIRTLLVHSKTKISPETELFLFVSDRSNHVRNVIIPSLQKKQMVLCDRFTDSTIAYQAFGRSLSQKLLDGMNKLATGGLKPDITFFLDLPVQAGLRRAKSRGALNRLDRESSTFYARVRKGYYFLARKNSRIVIIDGSQSAEAIHAQILQKVNMLLSKFGQASSSNGRNRSK